MNTHNISTTGSCEGHIDHGAPAPWVKVTTSGKQKNLQLRKKVSALLKMFYKNKNIRRDVRIVIEDGHAGFWIHNGGIAYKKDMDAMMARVVMRDKGKYVPNAIINAREKMKRARTLPLYQKEMKLFAQFLKSKRN